MFNKKWHTMLVLLLIVAIAATGCGAQGDSGKKNVNVPAALKEKGDISIKVIRKIGGDDHTAQFLAGAKQEAEALGFKVDTFSANNNSVEFLDAIDQAANSGVDAVILSHADMEEAVNAVQKLRDKGIEVVAFDSVGELSAIEGVTLTSQADESLAQFALDELVKEHNGEAKILYLWVDGFPPMIRRNTVYQDVLSKNPGIVELDRFGVASENTSVETQNAVAALLNKYPKGELDAIFATWDAFATGAARALIEAGRTEVKIYGIDVSNEDLQIMQEENSPWVATAAVDAKMVGAVNVRLAAKKLAGEETPATFDLDAALITQEALNKASETVNVATLSDIVPGWGTTDAFETDWIKALKEAK